VICDNCDREELPEGARDWLYSPSGRDFCPNCIIRLDDDPFVPEQPDAVRDAATAVVNHFFLSGCGDKAAAGLLANLMIALAATSEANVAPIPKKGGKE
jgi:hypothetical protein